MISNKKPVQDLLHLMASSGVKHVVISPGSRNAPLSYSFNEHPDFTCYSVIDERSAAYFALGMAQYLGEPVAVCCTSGTAAYNYGPAVAEAFYQRVPLIVLTADRPIEHIDQGVGQTIQQKGIYSSHVRYSAELIQETNDESLDRLNQRVISDALRCAMSPVKGPVHLNIPLKESLYNFSQDNSQELKLIEETPVINHLPTEVIKNLQNTFSKSEKVLIICSQLNIDSEIETGLNEIANQSNVLVITETTSNLSNDKYVACMDRLIMSLDEEESISFCPSLLITIGGNIISKKIKSLIQAHPPQEHWQLDADSKFVDTFQCLTKSISADKKSVLQGLSQSEKCNSDYGSKWRFKDAINKDKHLAYLNSVEFSDLASFKLILNHEISNDVVQMGNSSVVRYIQLFDPKRETRYFGNRGTSGIDGCTSTAVGSALVSGKKTLLISGDISFIYDSNGLWNNYLNPNLKIIVINNGGGGIFRIIDGPDSTGYLEEFFETKHDLRVQKLAEMHGLNYFQADSEQTTKSNLDALMQSDKAGILEIITPRELNDKILKDYFKYLSSNK